MLNYSYGSENYQICHIGAGRGGCGSIRRRLGFGGLARGADDVCGYSGGPALYGYKPVARGGVQPGRSCDGAMCLCVISARGESAVLVCYAAYDAGYEYGLRGRGHEPEYLSLDCQTRQGTSFCKNGGTGMITQMTLRNFKSVDEQVYYFSQFDLLVGRNNSGKSTVLQALV